MGAYFTRAEKIILRLGGLLIIILGVAAIILIMQGG